MKIEVRGIINNGVYESEKIVLDVLEDCNIGNYLVSTGQGRRNSTRNSFIFPVKELKKGDIIILHTKDGEEFINNINTEKTYNYFWNRNYCFRDYTSVFLMRYITQSTLEIR